MGTISANPKKEPEFLRGENVIFDNLDGVGILEDFQKLRQDTVCSSWIFHFWVCYKKSLIFSIGMLPCVGCFRIGGGCGDGVGNFAFGLKTRIAILRLHFPGHISLLYFLSSLFFTFCLFTFSENVRKKAFGKYWIIMVLSFEGLRRWVGFARWRHARGRAEKRAASWLAEIEEGD